MDRTPPPIDELLAQRRWVAGLARRLTTDDADAADVEQSAWLAALARPARDVRAPRQWFAAVLRNAARRLGRAEGRRARHESAAEVRDDDRPADELVAAAELQRRVAAAVLALDEPYRTSILLRFYEDLRPAAIAARLGVPEDTVRTRIRRGLAALRGRLDRDHDGRRAAWLLPLAAWERTWRAEAGSSGTASALAYGGAAMGLGKKAVALAALLVIASGGVLVILATGDSEAGAERASGDSGSVGERVRAPRASAHSETAGVAPRELGEPVDLGLCDRDLDLHGTVCRTDGTPVAGAELAVVGRPWLRTSVIHGREVTVTGPRTTSARDGTFALRLAAGDAVSLHVKAAGLVDAERRDCQAGERIRIVLASGVTLRAELVDESGAPCAGVRLRAFSVPAGDALVVDRRTTTDTRGSALFPDLPPSAVVQLAVESDDHGDPGWTRVSLPGEGTATQRIVLPAGTVLRGRVTDATTGAPVAGARVGMGTSLRHAVLAAEDGTYVFHHWTGLGVTEVAAEADGYAAATVSVGSRNTVDLELTRGFAASGRIVAPDGRPVDGALVSLVASARTEDGQRVSHGHAETDARGAFRIGGLAREMAHDLVVVARGHGRILRPVPSPTEGDLALGDVVLPIAQTIAGRVATPAGEPVARGLVTLRGPDWSVASPGSTTYGDSELRRTDDLGRFRFPDLAAGAYEIRVVPTGEPPVVVRTELPPGTPVLRRDIVAGSGRVLRVRVTDEAGAPVAGANVRVAHVGATDLGAQSMGVTGADGSARIAGLPRHVEACVQPPAGSPLLGTVWRAVADGVAEFPVVLHAPRRLRVRLLDPAGRPVADASVRITCGDERESFATTGEDGEFATIVPASGVSLEFGGIVRGAESGWTARCDALPAGDEVTLRCMAIETQRTLRVRVETPDGVPVAGARVVVSRRLWNVRPHVETEPDGVAELTGLPARELRVTAEAGAEFVAPALVSVTPAGQEIVLRARRGVAVRGVLVEPGGGAVRGAVAVRRFLAFGDVEELHSAETDAAGRFTVLVPEGTPGPFVLTAQSEGGLQALVTGVEPGDEVRVSLRRAAQRW